MQWRKWLNFTLTWMVNWNITFLYNWGFFVYYCKNNGKFQKWTIMDKHNINFIDVYFSLSRGIILWIELPWPENLVNTYTRHMETQDSCFDLIRSHKQCIRWSPPLASLVCDMNCWLSCRVSAMQSVVAGSISSGGDHDETADET